MGIFGKIGKLFQPNTCNAEYNPGQGSDHEHSWGNRRYTVDAARGMVRGSDECVYGCGAKREADIADIHHKGRRCS